MTELSAERIRGSWTTRTLTRSFGCTIDSPVVLGLLVLVHGSRATRAPVMLPALTGLVFGAAEQYTHVDRRNLFSLVSIHSQFRHLFLNQCLPRGFTGNVS